MKRFVRSNNLALFFRISEPMVRCSKQAGFSRIENAHVSGGNCVHGKRITSCVEAKGTFRVRTSHNAHKSIRGRLKCIKNGELRRESIEEHHDGRFALRLPFHEYEFIATASHPFDISNGQICKL